MTLKEGIGLPRLTLLPLLPLFSYCAGEFNKKYFTLWAIISIAWGTIGSVVIIFLPLIESWETIREVMLGMFTNDRLIEKVNEMNLKLHALVMALPEAERIYLLEKENARKKDLIDIHDHSP